jgi:sec-independent protein translocase protein TatA
MNVGDLFDSPLKIAIVAIVIIVLFGSKKLPGAARSLGQSMRILKKEVQGLHEDETAPGARRPRPGVRPGRAGHRVPAGSAHLSRRRAAAGSGAAVPDRCAAAAGP